MARRVSRYALAAATVAGLLVPGPAATAFCLEIPFRHQVQTFDSVLVGTVIRAEVRSGGGANNWRLRVQVDRVLRGDPVERRVTVLSSLGGPFIPHSQADEIKEAYEGTSNVVTIREEGTVRYWLGPHGCGGPAPVDRYLPKALRILGQEAHAPPAASETDPTASSTRAWVASAAVAAMLALVGSLWLLLRRRAG